MLTHNIESLLLSKGRDKEMKYVTKFNNCHSTDLNRSLMFIPAVDPLGVIANTALLPTGPYIY